MKSSCEIQRLYTELFVSKRTIDKSSDVSKGGWESPEKRRTEVYLGTNRYVRLPLAEYFLSMGFVQ